MSAARMDPPFNPYVRRFVGCRLVSLSAIQAMASPRTSDRLCSASATSDPGSLGGSIARYTAKKTQVSTDQTKLIESQEKLRAQLALRFAGVDSRVGASKSTLTFLQNQIDAWNASRN